MHLSFLLGGPCVLGAVSKCHQPRAVPRHLPEETAAALHFGSTLGPGKAESALSVPSPSTLPSTYALAYDCSSVFPSPDTFQADLLPAFPHHSSPQGILSITLLSEAFTN